MLKHKIYVLIGLLLSSVPVLAQSGAKPVANDHKNQVALPVTPALPGEEKLSAQERAERDFLMPSRRKRVPRNTAEEAQQAAAAEVTARNLEAAEEAAAEEKATPASIAHTRAYRRRGSTTHRTAVRSAPTARKHKATSKATRARHATKTKKVTKKAPKKAAGKKKTAKNKKSSRAKHRR